MCLLRNNSIIELLNYETETNVYQASSAIKQSIMDKACAIRDLLRHLMRHGCNKECQIVSQLMKEGTGGFIYHENRLDLRTTKDAITCLIFELQAMIKGMKMMSFVAQYVVYKVQ